MRSHLIKIFELNIIEHFPQDSRYVPQKVLPLAIVKFREIEAARARSIRQYETEQQKENRLKKFADIRRSKKELTNNCMKTQSLSIKCTDLENSCAKQQHQYTKDETKQQKENQLKKLADINQSKEEITNSCMKIQLPSIQYTDLENSSVKQQHQYITRFRK